LRSEAALAPKLGAQVAPVVGLGGDVPASKWVPPDDAEAVDVYLATKAIEADGFVAGDGGVNS